MHDTLFTDPSKTFIEIPATYHPKRFNHAFGLKNHHLLAWEKGSSARKALFTTPVSDSVLHDALVAIGAQPGNNLSQKTWSERRDRKSSYPDLLVEGAAVTIAFLKDSAVYQTGDFILDDHNRQFDFRFGGNRSLIPVWKSGCVVCLQSCPGAKIGNHTYSIRDLVNGESTFTLKKGNGFHERDTFIIRFTVNAEPE